MKPLEELNFRVDLLREAIRSNGLSQHKIAKKIKITDKAFSNKMNGITDWKLCEIQQIQELIKNLDVCEIFKLKKV